MPRPLLPAISTNPENPDVWGQAVVDAIYDVSDRVDELPAGGGGNYTVSGSTVGGAALDSFTGSTDDAKLTAFMSYAAAQTIKPACLLTNREHMFVQKNRILYSGFKMIGPAGFGNQQRGANSIGCSVKFTGKPAGTETVAVWFRLPDGSGVEIFDVQFSNIGMQGNSDAQFMATGPTAVLWTSLFRDMGWNLWKHVFGRPSEKLRNTAILIDGWHNFNNGYNTQFTFGGSDSNLFMDGALLDSPVANTAGFGGAYHGIFDYQEKTTVGPMFVTSERVSGIKIMGNADTVQLVLQGAGRNEGRNKDKPTYGASLRVDGHGGLTIRDWWNAYGFTNPGGSGHTGEGGTLTVTGATARVLLDAMHHSRATGVAETVPCVFQSGGHVRAINAHVEEGIGWSTTPGRPAFQSTGGTYVLDSTYTDRSTDACENWVGRSSYCVGQVANNGAYSYTVIGAGRSAATGGPTGTGSSIVDGTVTWAHAGAAQPLSPRRMPL